MKAACRFESSLKLLAQSRDPVAVVPNYFYGKSAVTTKADFGASVVSQFWLVFCWRAMRPRWTLVRICSAVAVQIKGSGFSLLTVR